MSKKLLIAVLLGLLFAFVGSAVADIGKERVARPTTNPSAPEYGQSGAVPYLNHVQQFGRPSGSGNDYVALPSGTVLAPPPKICDQVGYAINWTFFTRVPNVAIPRDYIAQRFSLADDYATCTLRVAYLAWCAGCETGTPDVTVDIWDDVLGYPGSIVGTMTIPYASLPVVDGYITCDFTSQNIVLTGDFYVSMTSPTAGAQANTLTDDGTAGQGRSYVHDGGVWYTRQELGFLDYNFDFIIDKCCIDPAFSDCFNIDYYCGVIAAAFGTPSTTGTRDMLGMRFTADSPDTLVDVYFAVNGPGPTFGTPDINVYVLPDVSGLPDETSPLYSAVIPNASIVWGDYNGVVLPPGIIVSGDFYVVVGATGGGFGLLSDDGSCAYGAGVAHNPVTMIWQTMFGRYGVDYGFLMGVDLCKDMYSECQTVAFNCTPYYAYSMPANSGSGRIGAFQRIDAAGIGSKLGKVRCPVTFFGGSGENDANAEIRVYSNDGVGGEPGTLLGSIGVTPPYPEWWDAGVSVEVDFSSMNIRFDGWVYVGIVSLDNSSGPADFYAQGDDDLCSTPGGMFILFDDGSWQDYAPSNYLAEAEICSVPVPERTCTPGESWPTSGHDFRRTGASMNSTGDAKCKQTLLWKEYDASGYVYARPVIYDTIVVVCANNRLRAYGINQGGAPMWTITGLPVLGSGVRIQPTVKDGYVYFGGGTNRGFSKANVYTGVVSWSRNPLNLPFAGSTVYTSSVILTVGGTEVVYLSTANGEVYALDAMTGLNYPGFNAGAPLLLDGDPLHTLSSNGVDKIYVATDGLFGTGYGTMYAIDAATGAIDWQLGETGLLGHAIDNDTGANIITLEIFQSPLAVDADGAIYALTSFNSEIDGTPSGAYYRINPNGTPAWGKPGRFGRFAGPIIDANAVYMTTLRSWTSELVEGSGIALKKSIGSTVWNTDPFFDGMAWVEGALSCEPGGVADLWYRTNQSFQMHATNTNDGLSEFEYNWDIINAAATPQRGCGVAIDPTHVVFNTRQGDLFVLANGINDRPRLRILKFDELFSVPFFSPNPTFVTYDDVFMNNGCANLTGTISADEIPPPAYRVTSVHPDRIDRMANAADAMVNNSYSEMVKAIPVDNSVTETEFDSSPLFRDNYSNKAAYAPPSWLNSIVVTAFNLAPGQTFDVQYDVNGPLVTRGPHYCYVTITSNDQYYLNSTNAPVVQLGVLGGCTETYDELHFGTATQNVAPVYPTGELASQELGVLWEIDGDNAPVWQGSLWYMAGTYRLAWNSDTWHGGDAANFWNSLLPDVNLCNQCEPVVTPSAIPLAYKWDGTGYNTVVNGNVAYTRYIDSVVNFDCFGTGWDWRANIACPYDDTLSMGLMVDAWMYGVTGDAAYNNVVIWRLDIQNRNAVPMPGFRLGAYVDFDLAANATDIWKFSASHSISWGYSCNQAGPTKVWGMGKIPMDTDPMIGCRTIDQNQAMWHASDVALDSMYLWATTQPGETFQAGIGSGAGCGSSGDRAVWFSFVGHDFAPSETYTTGIYFFGFGATVGMPGDTAGHQALALRVNQLAGFGRGDINGDNVVNLADVVALANGTDHAVFAHLADVNASGGAPDAADTIYLANFWFCQGPGPVGAWVLPTAICP